MAELEACATALEKQIEYSVSQMRVAEFIYWHLCAESQTPK